MVAALSLSEVAAEVERLHKNGERTSVDTAIRIGAHLEDTRERLMRADWGRWFADNVCIPKQTAQRHRDVYRLSREAPRLVRTLRHHGATRLARLARVRPDARDAAILALSGGDACALSSAEYNEVTRPLLRTPKRTTPPVPPALRHADALLLDMTTSPVPSLPHAEIDEIETRLQRICDDRQAYVESLRAAAADSRPVPPVGPNPHPSVPPARPRPPRTAPPSPPIVFAPPLPEPVPITPSPPALRIPSPIAPLPSPPPATAVPSPRPKPPSTVLPTNFARGTRVLLELKKKKTPGTRNE